MSDCANILMLIATIVATAFAGWSALEARSARRIARTDLLSKHFLGVEYLFEIIERPISCHYGEAADKVSISQEDLHALKTILFRDKVFVPVLDRIDEIFKAVPRTSAAIHNGPPWSPPQDYPNVKNLFDAKKREYLNIG